MDTILKVKEDLGKTIEDMDNFMKYVTSQISWSGMDEADVGGFASCMRMFDHAIDLCRSIIDLECEIRQIVGDIENETKRLEKMDLKLDKVLEKVSK